MSNMLAKIYPTIPREIRSIITERFLCPGEDPDCYDNLLGQLINYFQPSDVMQWLDVKKLHDLMWEQLRMNRIKPGVLVSAYKSALKKLLLSTMDESVHDYTPGGNIAQAEEGALAWFTDSAAKQKVIEQLQAFNYSQQTIDAQAFVERQEVFLTMEKMQAAKEARQYAIRQQLEEGGSDKRHRFQNDNQQSTPARLVNKRHRSA